LNGGISIQRPPPPPCPGPAPKSTGQANTVLGQCLVDRQNEKQIVELFATVRLAQTDDSKPGDVDIANSQDIPDKDKDKAEYTPTKRYTYSREHKLAVIDYFQTTWKVNRDSTYKHMLNQYTVKKLKIS
jgi:hypothetical protein